jgi:Bacterial Ig domain
MRRSALEAALLAAMCISSSAFAQTPPSDVRVEVVVTVIEEQRPSGYVYRYRVENRSSFAIGSFLLGFNHITNETEFEVDPIAIEAPAGWNGSVESDEGPYCVVWQQVDPTDTVHEIAPGGALEGFEVTLPRPSPEFRKATFTTYMTDAVYDVGNVKPAPETPMDRRAPTVALTAPAAGATLSGLVAISADATDETGVADVRLLLDGEDITGQLVEPHLDSAPYSALWRTYGVPNGAHTLAAVARDTSGNRSTSAPISVTLQNDESPLTISLTSPVAGASVSGTAALSATASSGSRVMGVLFRVDGVNLGTWVSAPPYSTSWDTTTVPNGSHSLTATVMDEAGGVEQTPAVAVTVANGGAASSIAETEPGKLWVGLKNSDDQGTRFDLRVALYLNNAQVAEGIMRCVTGLTRNAAQAKEVTVPFGSISSHQLAAGSVMALRVSTRIGTNPDDSRCGGHANAVGLRLYYDAAGRPSRLGARMATDPMKSFFLHASGGSFLLDTASPTATPPKEKDSGPVTFSGGNPWREIGTWSRSLP